MNFFTDRKNILIVLASLIIAGSSTAAALAILSPRTSSAANVNVETPAETSPPAPAPHIEKNEIFADWQQSPGIPVLCYHQIVTEEEYRAKPTPYAVTDKQFDEQMALIAQEGYYTVTTRQFEAHLSGKETLEFSPRRKPILITFDDGVNDFNRFARRTLDRHNFKAVLFIYPTYIMAKKKRSLTWEELREIARSGHEIGSHALWHPNLSELNEKEQQYQFAESKKILEKNIPGITVDTLAYPFGVFTDASQRLLRETGYRLAFTTFRGGNLPGQNPLTAKRYLIVKSDTSTAFRSYLHSRSLPAQLRNLSEGAWLSGATDLKLSLPRNLDAKALQIKVFSTPQPYRYDASSGNLTVYLTPSAKKLSNLEIILRQGDVQYRSDLLFNNENARSKLKK